MESMDLLVFLEEEELQGLRYVRTSPSVMPLKACQNILSGFMRTDFVL